MKELQKAYDLLVSQHDTLLAQAEKDTFCIQYTRTDFFSLEPMNHEINHISKDKIIFYQEIEEMPPGSELFICVISEKQLLQSRNSYGADTYYDSFYTYDENEKWRLELYVNPDIKKPVKVERLITDKSKLPLCYERYQENSYWKFDYSYSGDKQVVECNYYDGKGNFIFNKVLDVLYSEAADGIESITCSLDGKLENIYNYINNEKSRDDILEEAKVAVIEGILSGLDKEEDINEAIECLLLEYTCQGPFPPHVGFSAKEKVKKGEDPLKFYWVNEMQHQLQASLNEGNEALFDAANDYFDQAYEAVGYDLDEEEQNAIYEIIGKEIFEIYVDICKRLKSRRKLKTLIPATKTFHVTARDFEQCNEWDFLKVLLPKSRVQALSNKLLDFEHSSVLNADEQALYDKLQNILETENSAYQGLKTELESKRLTIKYSIENYMYIEPFEFEKSHNYKNDIKLLKNSSYLSDSVEGGNYRTYLFEKDELIYMTHHRDGELWEETFFTRQQEMLKVHIFHYFTSGLALESYWEYTFSGTRLMASEHYHYGRVNSMVYNYDESDLLEYAIETSRMLDPKFSSVYISRFVYEYDQENHIYKIIRNVDKYDKSSVDYCRDDSYIHEHIVELVKQLTNTFISVLSKNLLNRKIAIAVKLQDNLVFNFFDFHLLSLSNGKVSWEEISLTYEKIVLAEDLIMNFYSYTGENSYRSDESSPYVSITMKLLKQAVEQGIKTEFDKDIDLLYYSEHESGEQLETYLLKKVNI